MSAHADASSLLRLEGTAEVDRICSTMLSQVRDTLKRRGVVLGLSGGIDSSVCAALAVRAFGADRVIGLFMPEADSSPDSLELGRRIAEWLGIRSFLENITPVLDGAGCYRRRDEAIRGLVPGYGDGYKCKIVLPPPGSLLQHFLTRCAGTGRHRDEEPAE